MNICPPSRLTSWILKSFLALIVFSGSAQAALPPDNSSVLYCEATTSDTNFKDYRIAWTYNSPLNTLLPDHTGGSWANGQFDESVLASASAQLVGSGMGYSFDLDKQTVIHLTGVDQASALGAYQANDFIEYQFTTKADMNQAQLFNGFAFASHNYTQNYKIDVLLSEDNFATATTVLSDYMVQPVQSPPNDNPWYQWIDFPTDNAAYLKPDTTYKFRILFYGASNTNAVYWDDFHVSMGLCQDYSDAPAASYGAASHDQPRATTHYLGGSIADAETGASDGGDAGVGADGDDTSGTRPDDEDGVIIPALTQGSSATLTATVSGAGGYLQGWIDWNGDGSFDDTSGSNEIIAAALQDNANGGAANNTDTNANNGTISFTVNVPADATTDQTYARFRWSTVASLDAITNASNGEVEDYAVTVTAASPGPDPMCNVVTELAQPNYTAFIEASRTGLTGLGLGTISSANNVVNSNSDDYATLSINLGLLASANLSVKDSARSYPAGYYAGFDIANASLVGLSLLNNSTVRTYLDGTLQETVSGSDLSASAAALSASGRQTIGFITNLAFDEVRYTLTQAAGVDLGATLVYSAIIEKFCPGTPLSCNATTPLTAPAFPALIDDANTGTGGLACLNCEVKDAANVVTASDSDYASISLLGGIGASGSLAVQDVLTDYESGTFVGFEIENSTLLGASLLGGITISTYLDGALQESQTGSSELASTDTSLVTSGSRDTIGFVATAPFDTAKITISNTVSADVGDTKVYKVVLKKLCAVALSCDNTYRLSSPTFPVTIDSALTGVDGTACAACSVSDTNNGISESESDYSTITTAAGVATTTSYAVLDAVTTYPRGSTVGFTIKDVNNLVELDLFNSLEICTYNDKALQECRSATELLSLTVLESWVVVGTGSRNVGFETTLPFDTVQLKVGSLASSLNVIQVSNAYVDTSTANGDGLLCLPELDYSDAPADGSTTPNGTASATSYGDATHTFVAGQQLGANIDLETASIASADAMGDGDDDDGIQLPILINGALNYSIVKTDITTVGTGTLHAWIDFDGNGMFDTDEYNSTTVSNGVVAGDLIWTLSGADGNPDFTLTSGSTTFARFRFTSDITVTASTPTSIATDGEVEDYAVTVEAALIPTSSIYTPQGSCAAAGFIETFGSGVGRSPLPAGVTNYIYESALEVQDGKYALVDQSSIAGAGSWWIVDNDHTPNDTDGKMLLVNASDVQGASAEFYRQNLTGLEVGKQYALSAYIANADNSTAATRIHPNVKLSLESGAAITSVDTGEILRDPGGDELAWQEYRFLFTATQTNVDIVLSNAGVGGSGNDLVIDDISVYEFCQDFGDAPVDGTSPNGSSTNNYGAAIHAVVSGTYLGSSDPDIDSANQPSADAGYDGSTGDDGDGTDDEDGISAFPTLTAGDATYTIPAENITTVGIGTLHAWIDFDGNGVFDADEHSSPTTSGGALSWTMNGADGNPDFTLSGAATSTFARFRFTSDTTITASTPASIATDGEVEDYRVSIIANDYGDAPGYGDAYHAIDGAIFLGSAPDAEAATETTNGDASDDANDDGVFTDAALTTGLQGTSLKPEDSTAIYIPVTGTGKLYAWIDWDANGVFGNNSNELIANGIDGTDETLIINASVPISANLSTTYARFRFSSDATLSDPTGLASDGEVEDYQVTVANTPTAPTAPPIAYCSNTWTLDGGVYKTTTSQGIAISASTTAEAGAAWSFAPNDALNTSGNFSFAALNGSPSLSTVFTWDTSPEDGRLANAADDDATGTLTFSFGVPVKNPILHIDRQGGYGSSTAASPQGKSNSSIITPNAANNSATFTRLAGTTHFEVTTDSIQRTPNETMQDTGATGASGVDSTLYTAMGSVQVNGTFNSLSLDLNGVGVEGAGADGIEFVICAEPYDYGDAPASYGEAAHKIPDTPVVYLGDVAPDHEPQIQHTANGGSDGAGDDLNGSDDEDAYEKLPAVWTSQSRYRLTLACSDTDAFVSGWIDFNQNNQFDAGERNTDYPTQCDSSGNVTLNWTGLSGLTTGNTYARLRIGSESDDVSAATGTASDGEVEDYPIVLQAPGTPPGACNGEMSWLNLTGQPAYPTANWSANWAERGLNATLGFSTTMTGSNAKWAPASPKLFTDSTFANRFSSPGHALGLNYPGDNSGTGSTIANIGFDAPLPANTYLVVRDIDAANESISFSNSSLGSLPAPSLWETQSSATLNGNGANNPSLFATWDSANQTLTTLSEGPENDEEAYVWSVAGLTDIRVTYQTTDGSANVGFVSCIPQDYGDAPNTYLTTKSAAGPQHGIINGVQLGTNTPDTDTDGQPSADANGDGADEDGISGPLTLTSSDRSFSATVSVSNDTASPATLVGWIDFDNNGTLDADEAAIRTIAAGSSNASYSLNWSNIPVGTQVGNSYLRLRITTDLISNREPGGAKRDGEVEDYPITITKAGVTVSGRVYRDVNVNALNDSTELGVTSLPVVLYDTVNERCRSTRTNGTGHYTFEDVVPGTYQMYEASREKMPIPKYCDPAFAKDPSGYRSTTNKVREAFTMTTNDITGQDFGNVKLPVFEPDNTGQILPGNVLFYAHKFTTPTAGSVRFSSLSSTHRSSGWSSIIYRDENCDGKLNQSDGASPLETSSMEVNANDKVCLINKVYAPSNVAANDQYAQNITADFDFENIVAGTLALTVRDVTTAKQVQAPALPATPEVVAEPITPAQDPVDATPATPYIPEVPEAPAQAQVDPTPVTPAVGPSRLELRKTVKNITQGTAETSTVNSAEPGNTLEYRIYYSNTGTGPLSDLIVNDRVPAYTELVGVADCGIILPDMGCTASPLSLDDALKWTFTGPLLGGTGSSVSYQVVIDQ